MLSTEEIKRYNRHLILEHVGKQGQEKLKAAKVLVIGAGGLGCPALQYLAAAGVGTIGIVDFDTVAASNLQRQVLFRTEDIGRNKATCAAETLQKLNPHINFEVHAFRLTAENALDLFKRYDLILDGTDNFSTRYLVNDASLLTGKPLVYGSIYKFQGQVSVFNYQNGPSYRCLFPIPPENGTIKNCSEIGVIGVLPGIIGTQQANEALKIILEIGTPLTGKLLLYDALTADYSIMQFDRDSAQINEVLQRRNTFETFDYDLFCGVNQTNTVDGEIDVEQFNQLIGDDTVQIIDLREEWEEPELKGSNVQRILMSDINDSIDLLSDKKEIVLFCQTGGRSEQVKTYLETMHQFKNIVHLKGGIESYE